MSCLHCLLSVVPNLTHIWTCFVILFLYFWQCNDKMKLCIQGDWCFSYWGCNSSEAYQRDINIRVNLKLSSPSHPMLLFSSKTSDAEGARETNGCWCCHGWWWGRCQSAQCSHSPEEGALFPQFTLWLVQFSNKGNLVRVPFFTYSHKHSICVD